MHWHWGESLALGRIIGVGENHWRWGESLALGRIIGVGENHWHWGESLALGRIIGIGENHWRWGESLAFGRIIGVGENHWRWGESLALGRIISTELESRFPYWEQIWIFSAECDETPEGRWVSFNMPHRHSLDIEYAFLDIPRLLDIEGGICTTYVYVYRACMALFEIYLS